MNVAAAREENHIFIVRGMKIFYKKNVFFSKINSTIIVLFNFVNRFMWHLSLVAWKILLLKIEKLTAQHVHFS